MDLTNTAFLNIIRTMAFAMALSLTAGCHPHNTGDSDTPIAVHFVAEPLGFASPESKRPWDIEGSIGISMISPYDTSIILEYKNIRYIYTSAQQGFSPSGETIYYPINGKEVRFTAYFPHTTLDGHTMTVDLRNQPAPEDQESNQLLWAPPTTTYTKDSPNPVLLEFERQYARINIRFSPSDGTSLEDLKNMKLSISDMVLQGHFNVMTGQLENGDLKGEIWFKHLNSDSTRMSALVLPVEASDSRTFSFRIGDAFFSHPIPEEKFEKGHSYAYHIRISNSGIEGLEASVEPWEEDNSGSGDVL